MITESRYWKGPLLRAAQRFERLTACAELSERQQAQVEKDLLVGFYSIRKLLDTPLKLTDRTRSTMVTLTRFPNDGTLVTLKNNHRLDELYDFEKPQSDTRDVRFLCNSVIHSFMLMPVRDETGLSAIWFTSDFDKDRCLYELRVRQLVELFRLVGSDYPRETRIVSDVRTGQVSTSAK